jgi:alpha-galactosidase
MPVTRDVASFNFDLCPTPPMGFNTWNRFGRHINEDLIVETLQAVVSSGLRDAGYVYVNLDDGWMAPERDGAGHLVPDPQRFPGGIARIADRAHAMGLKLGIYSDCGTKTCEGLPASFGHEEQDARTFAAWGIDFLKQDWCHVPLDEFPDRSEREVAQILYGRMSRALFATGRPIVLSMCNWGHGQPWEWARGVGHLWRTTGDIVDAYRRPGDRWTGDMVGIFHRNVELADFAGPGGFNDPDMLEVGNGGMTDVEYRTHFALWCMMAAPLLIGTDVRRMSDATRSILLNRDLIAVNQDALGRQARRVAEADGVHTLVKPLADGDTALAVFNEGDSPAEADPWGQVPGATEAKDLWTGAAARLGRPVAVDAHATEVWRVRRG